MVKEFVDICSMFTFTLVDGCFQAMFSQRNWELCENLFSCVNLHYSVFMQSS